MTKKKRERESVQVGESMEADTVFIQRNPNDNNK